MALVPPRTGPSGPALTRLLARLGEVEAGRSPHSTSDRLSLWLGWADAIALASALDGTPPPVPAGSRASAAEEEREYARVRRYLVQAIAADTSAAGRRRDNARVALRKPAREPGIGYADFRQCYLLLQKTMETEIAGLRSRLRSGLAAKASEATRLAVVDAVMERVLGARERALLASAPALLEKHFERLRQAARETEPEAAGPDAAAAPAADAWVELFRKDMRSVLLAELDVRLQPVEGLLAALRAS